MTSQTLSQQATARIVRLGFPSARRRNGQYHTSARVSFAPPRRRASVRQRFLSVLFLVSVISAGFAVFYYAGANRLFSHIENFL